MFNIFRLGGTPVAPVQAPRKLPKNPCLSDDDCPPASEATLRLIEAVERNGPRDWAGCPATRLADARKAIEDGAEVDVLLNHKYPTLLYGVVCHGDKDLDMIRLLVAAGADIHLAKIQGDDDFYNPAADVLSMTIMQGQWQAAMLMVELGADVNNDFTFTTFVSCPEFGFDNEEVALAKAMFDAGGNCDHELLASMRASPNAMFLTDTEDWAEPGKPTMIDLLEQWMAERDRLAMERKTAPAPAPSRPAGRL